MLRQRLLRQCPTSRVDCRYRGARNVPNRSPRIGKLAAQAPAAAPAQTSSPFAAVQTEEQLLAVLKAGASSGQVRLVSVLRNYKDLNLPYLYNRCPPASWLPLTSSTPTTRELFLAADFLVQTQILWLRSWQVYVNAL